MVTIGIALVQMAIFLGLGKAAFGLELTGWWWMGIPLLVAGTLCFMALGLFAGAVARTTEGAVNMANFLVLPMAFLSGSFFPLEAAPPWLQTVSLALPLQTPERRHARRTRPRRGAVGRARADGDPDGVRGRDDRRGGPVVQVGPGLSRGSSAPG